MENRKITPTTEVTTSELACVLGLTGRRIRQLAEDGQLQKAGQGRFSLCDSVQQYIRIRSDAPVDGEVAKIERSKLTADAKIKQTRAEILEMEAKELKGKMHRSEDVAAMTEDLVYTIRGMLLALPGRLAMDAAAAASSAEAAELIRREIYKVMAELARYRYDPARYEKKVRGRMNWDMLERTEDDD